MTTFSFFWLLFNLAVIIGWVMTVNAIGNLKQEIRNLKERQ